MAMDHRRGSRAPVATLLAVLLSTGIAGSSTAEVRVEYRTSRMFGLFMFASTIAGFPNRPGALAEIFRTSRYNTSETQAQIEEFRDLHRGLLIGIDFSGFPPSRPNGTNLEQTFAWRALDARDLDELRRMARGLIPLAREQRYFELLSEIDEIYEPLIWQPSEERLEAYRGNLEAKARELGMGEMFEKAARFYDATWPAGLPFTVALYPIPAQQGHTSAESAGSLEIVAVLLDDRDLPNRFGIMFHEMCHSLYEAEPVEVQQAFESYFREVKTPQADLAYTLINEALATAVGNGWAIETATGKRDRDSWYDDATIDGFAKAIYPMVREYISDGRSLDRSFARKSIELFGATFPDAPYRFDTLFREIVLMTDGDSISMADIRDELRAAFPVSNIYATSPVDDERSLRYLTEQRATVIVAVGEEQAGQLAPLGSRFPSIADGLRELRAATGGRLLVGSEQGRAIVVMKVLDRKGIARAVDELKMRRRLDPSRTEIVRLD